MKLDIEFLVFAGLLGFGAYLLINRAVKVKSFYATNVIPIYNYPIQQHPPGTIITETEPPIEYERGKEDYSPYGYIEPSKYISPEMMNVPLDPNEPPNIRDPREIQADLLSSQKESTELSYLKTESYPPLSEAQIARELQRKPVGYQAGKGWRVLTGYPGFVRRPADGLLQWDGHTIPDFLEGTYREAQNDCSRETGEDLLHCQTARENWRKNLEQLRNRPWYPGYDVTGLWQEVTSQKPRRDTYGKQPQGSFRNLADWNYMFGRPHAMITAEEELRAIQTKPDIIGMMEQEHELREEAGKERLGIGKPGNLDPGDEAIIARKEAERVARKARTEALTKRHREESRAKALAELQKWTNSSYVGAYLGDSGKGWSMHRRSL